ncbi:creatininase family protein [Prauserella flavalba]|uniref:Creatinine amidohydrolase n=1 Tax=Prauserella flavalba TaxID=1477506 RepID=A0A318LHF7_9PSEU|nr:creatininase family protein [Prauserella flavalba]PXY28835.1 hypothetical protein BA062_23685 [Prauserella flavalba]
MYFAELSSPQVAALRESGRVPVLLLPVGAVEAPGPHAPLGTGPLIARGVCERAAARLAGDERVRALILPMLSYGVTGTAEPGTLPIGAETLHGLVVDVCTALARQDLPRVVVVNSHPGSAHRAALRRAVDTVESRCGRRIAHVDLDGGPAGGCSVASLVLAERPELVDTERTGARGTDGVAAFEALTVRLVDVIRDLALTAG